MPDAFSEVFGTSRGRYRALRPHQAQPASEHEPASTKAARTFAACLPGRSLDERQLKRLANRLGLEVDVATVLTPRTYTQALLFVRDAGSPAADLYLLVTWRESGTQFISRAALFRLDATASAD